MERNRLIRRLVLTSALVFSACANGAKGADEEAEDDPMLVGAPALDTATTVAPPPASSSSAPTSAAPTTATPNNTTSTTVATTTIALPVPSPSPLDARAAEASTELGTVEIPKIGVRKPLREGVRLTTLDLGPGHWPGTAMPGQIGNMVIAGHRVTHGQPFRHLDKLSAGDEVRITATNGAATIYRVLRTEIVPSNALWIVNQTPEATGTLFACHPPGSARQRIVVHLRLAQS